MSFDALGSFTEPDLLAWIVPFVIGYLTKSIADWFAYGSDWRMLSASISDPGAPTVSAEQVNFGASIGYTGSDGRRVFTKWGGDQKAVMESLLEFAWRSGWRPRRWWQIWRWSDTPTPPEFAPMKDLLVAKYGR